MEDKEEEIKEQFYEKSQRTQDRVPKHDVIIIMGDMNATLGKEKVFSQVIGRRTSHNISNKNGEMVANYAISNGMILISTNFQHKKKSYWNVDIPRSSNSRSNRPCYG
jgi:hypothetical protein